MLNDPRWSHVAQAELEAAREHRHRNLLRVRRRKNELHILGRLLKGLQHRVEGRIGEHVHFVDHVDLVAAFGRRIHGALKKLRHILDGAVRGRIHLDIVNEASFINRAAGLADAAGVRGDAALAVGAAAVERLGENARNRGFADAAGAGKEIGVMQTPFGEGARQRRDHVVLADDRLKVMGAPLARKYLVAAHGMRLILFASQAHILANGPPGAARALKRIFQIRKWRALSSALHAHQYGCFVPDLTRFPGRACEGTRQAASIGKKREICKKLLLKAHENVLPARTLLPEVLVLPASHQWASRRYSEGVFRREFSLSRR